jgi:hypothetical protein
MLLGFSPNRVLMQYMYDIVVLLKVHHWPDALHQSHEIIILMYMEKLSKERIPSLFYIQNNLNTNEVLDENIA